MTNDQIWEIFQNFLKEEGYYELYHQRIEDDDPVSDINELKRMPLEYFTAAFDWYKFEEDDIWDSLDNKWYIKLGELNGH